MRYFFTLITFIVFFSGCSHNNAFTNFHLNKEQERSISSLQSSKVKLGERVDGVFSAIYLNEVYPDIFNQYEYFYVYLYLKDDKKMYDPNSLDDIETILKLNGKAPIKVKQLPPENQFSNLTLTSSRWNKYYIVAFKESGKKLNLTLNSGAAKSAVLKYQKDEQ